MNAIHRPADSKFIVVYDFLIAICDGNQCAAAILSFLIYKHGHLQTRRELAVASNDVAEAHREERSQDESLLMSFTEADIESGILLFKRRSFPDAIELLKAKGFLTVTANPNPKFSFDKRRFFSLEVEEINRAIARFTRERKNASSSRKNASSTRKSAGYNTENSIDNLSSSSHSSEEERRAQKNAAKKKSSPTLEETLVELSADKTYSHCDVRFEAGKCQRWCEANNKIFSRKRLINWLNKIERPLSATPSSPQGAQVERKSIRQRLQDKQKGEQQQ